jgi:hypothetical protein
MKGFEAPSLGDGTQACWRTGRKSRFKIREKFVFDSVNSRYDRGIMDPLEGANDCPFCQQTGCSQIHEAFPGAIQKRNGGTVESLPLTDFVCNLLIKVPHIWKRQMIQIPN